jgi:hypothetical protein
MTEPTLQEVPCTKGVAGVQFIQGVQDFPFSIGYPSVWVPSRSYFRVEMELLGSGDPATATQPTLREQTAFADDAVGCLFSNVYMRGGGQDMSSITSFAPQASALKKRLNKTQPWLQSLGKYAYLSEADFTKRCLSVSNDAIATTGLYAQNDIYTVADNAQFLTATVAVAAATSIVTGTDTTFTANDVGNLIVINGLPYTIKTFTDATPVVLAEATIGNITATTNFDPVRRNTPRTHQARNKV